MNVEEDNPPRETMFESLKRSILERIAKDLSKSDSFVRNWYGWSTNQIGHVFLGVFFTGLLIWVGNTFLHGAVPQKAAVIWTVGFYACVWEWKVQGWRGWDSFADTRFFATGSSLYLFLDVSFEVELSKTVTFLTGWTTIDVIMLVCVIILTDLFLGIASRIKGD